MSVVWVCFSCGTQHTQESRVSYREECSKCGADAHVCKNCEFYDVKAYNECREPAAERVVEKERANYCDYFSPAAGVVEKISSAEQLKAAAEALFKKK